MRRRGIAAGFGAVRVLAACVAISALAAACTLGGATQPHAGSTQHAKGAGNLAERVAGGSAGWYIVPPGIHKIKHVIVIMQENRSFDSYFGTYPGADGIPVQNGV
ncbi:MAG: alkaline phosphatase family protein, partial [Streptosporangiaceae bacterium]